MYSIGGRDLWSMRPTLIPMPLMGKTSIWTSSLNKPAWSLPWRFTNVSKIFRDWVQLLKKKRCLFLRKESSWYFCLANPQSTHWVWYKGTYFSRGLVCRGVFLGGCLGDLTSTTSLDLYVRQFFPDWVFMGFISIIQHHLGEYFCSSIQQVNPSYGLTETNSCIL